MLLVEAVASRQLVAACCPRSASQGVKPGMTLAHARALIGPQNVIEAPYEPKRDEAALRSLARWAIRFTPLVAPDPPNGVLLEVSGCQRLYGDDRRLLNVIGNTLHRMGVRSRLACAGTIGAAWALARCGESERSVIEPGQESAALAPLPLESLRLEPETLHGLHELNIDRVEHVLALPRLELVTRFGPRLLQRVDQALGETEEIIEPIRPACPVLAERCFDGPVTNMEAIFLTARELIDEITAALLRRESGAMRLEMIFDRVDLTPLTVWLQLSRPSRDPRHLWSLLHPRIESIHMGYGIESMMLRAVTLERIAHNQIEGAAGGDRVDTAVNDHAASELVDTLSERLGWQRTLCLQIAASYRPERVIQHVPALTNWPPEPPAAALVTEDRPSVLLKIPMAIDVMAVTPDGPPFWLRWCGSELRLISACGPHRIACEWWSALTQHTMRATTRDYFRVQDERGRWLWIFREDRRGWFMHGEWA